MTAVVSMVRWVVRKDSCMLNARNGTDAFGTKEHVVHQYLVLMRRRLQLQKMTLHAFTQPASKEEILTLAMIAVQQQATVAACQVIPSLIAR